MELNRQQIVEWSRIGLAAGGPIGGLILHLTGLTTETYMLWVQAALYIVPPPIGFVLSWYANRRAAQILNVKAMPEVATIVIKDAANGDIGKLARSPDQPDIVTETQNERDAKLGTKTS